MARLTIREHTRVARLAVVRARSGLLSRALGSPFLRWRYGAPIGEELVMIPQELRAADPSFAEEIAEGEFGLAGWVAHSESGSPFDLMAPSEAWARELHGFAWLRHLRAAATPKAKEIAVRLVGEWLATGQSQMYVALESAVMGRRIVSWLANAGLLLEDVDQATFDRTTQSLADQLIHLSATWRCTPEGYPRLVAIMGLVYGDLCIAGHERHLEQSEAMLGAELDRQILPDGGHLSRNTSVLIELMLDLLPLRQCFVTHQRTLPDSVAQAISRILPALRYMRLGDGSLARFNGVGAPPMAELGTILAYDEQPARHLSDAPQSRYVRLEQASLVLIADVGGPPAIELAGEAHAGCLSFEISAGRYAILVNGGASGPADHDLRAASRATASHNTLCLGDKSSSKLLRQTKLERVIGGSPIRGPQTVNCSRARTSTGDVLEAFHNGYVDDFGLQHRRRLLLCVGGGAVEGIDWLAGPSGSLRFARDIPFAIHFHLHPDVQCEALTRDGIELRLRDGTNWRFSASGAELSLEPSTHYAGSAGPVRSRQIGLRGACWGETEVSWRLARIES